MTFNKIGWCHFTVGFWSGCTEVSPACDNCYAREMLQNRFGLVTWGAKQPRRPSLENAAKELRRINNKAKRDGIRYRVFINSASDTFDAEVPDEWRDAVFAAIREAPHIDALVLTKRPTLARRYREFRDNILLPALATGRTVIVDLCGLFGMAASFQCEAFAGAIRGCETLDEAFRMFDSIKFRCERGMEDDVENIRGMMEDEINELRRKHPAVELERHKNDLEEQLFYS